MGSEEQIAPAIRSILAAARDRDPPPTRVSISARSLEAAVADAARDGRVPIIAEIKPTSPTTSGVHTGEPVTLAEEMVAGGAAALSVLTEPDHFDGSPEMLTAVRDAVDVPVLRKDFVMTETDLDRVAADVVLLIARFVDDLPALIAAARDRGFQVLVEVHTLGELETALAADVRYIGINNRDLTSLTVDRDTFGRVVTGIPSSADVTVVAESGIETPAHVRQMLAAGADALLIGTAIMDGDVRENTRQLTRA